MLKQAFSAIETVEGLDAWSEAYRDWVRMADTPVKTYAEGVENEETYLEALKARAKPIFIFHTGQDWDALPETTKLQVVLEQVVPEDRESLRVCFHGLAPKNEEFHKEIDSNLRGWQGDSLAGIAWWEAIPRKSYLPRNFPAFPRTQRLF